MIVTQLRHFPFPFGLIKFAILRPRSTMDSIRVSEAPDPSSILGEATKKNPTDWWDFLLREFVEFRKLR